MTHFLSDSTGNAFVQRIVAIRHGERRDDAVDAIPEADPPLTVAGRANVSHVAERLRRALGTDEAAALQLVVSPFTRTRETAEELQRCGIGNRTTAVVDRSICEVFGPARIKCDTAPELPLCSLTPKRLVRDQVSPESIRVKGKGTLDAHLCTTQSNAKKSTVTKSQDSTHADDESDVPVCGRLPAWGESIASATDRYVARFYYIAEQGVAGATLTPSASRKRDSGSTSSSTTSSDSGSATSHRRTRMDGVSRDKSNAIEEMKWQRQQKRGEDKDEGADEHASAQTRALYSNAVNCALVTHGDAVSAILSHFYPNRIVYETQYLCFIVMARHDPHDMHFTLEYSHGVHWISEDGAHSESEEQAADEHDNTRSRTGVERASQIDSDNEYNNCTVELATTAGRHADHKNKNNNSGNINGSGIGDTQVLDMAPSQAAEEEANVTHSSLSASVLPTLLPVAMPQSGRLTRRGMSTKTHRHQHHHYHGSNDKHSNYDRTLTREPSSTGSVGSSSWTSTSNGHGPSRDGHPNSHCMAQTQTTPMLLPDTTTHGREHRGAERSSFSSHTLPLSLTTPQLSGREATSDPATSTSGNNTQDDNHGVMLGVGDKVEASSRVCHRLCVGGTRTRRVLGTISTAIASSHSMPKKGCVNSSSHSSRSCSEEVNSTAMSRVSVTAHSPPARLSARSIARRLPGGAPENANTGRTDTPTTAWETRKTKGGLL